MNIKSIYNSISVAVKTFFGIAGDSLNYLDL